MGINKKIRLRMTTKVLVPFDLKPVSERAVKFALEEYSGKNGVTIHAVHFNEKKHDTVEDVINRTVREFAEERGFDTENLLTEVVEREEPVDHPRTVGDIILEYAGKEEIDHVVMGQHNRSWLKNLVRGSASDKVAENAAVPVTLVP